MSKTNIKYKNYMQGLFQDTQQSFHQIQTPGWTSIMNTEQSNVLKNSLHKQQTQNINHEQILNRLKILPKIDQDNKFYSNIRCNSSIDREKNVIIYAEAKTQQKIKNTNKFLNRFSSNKKYNQSPQIQRKSLTHRKKIPSFKSQGYEQSNLTNGINNRIYIQNKNIILSDFDKKISYNSLSSQQKKTIQNAIYKKGSNLNIGKTKQTKLYINRYMDKLNKRNVKSSITLKLNSDINKKPSSPIKDPIQNIIKDATNVKRFNVITVHDHLYKAGQRLQSKKNMYKLIEQSYQKAATLTFNPKISQKSTLLAQSKFQKKQNFNEKRKHQSCYSSIKHNKKQSNSIKENYTTSAKQKITTKQKQIMNQKLQNFVLLKLFNFLSQGNYILQEHLMQSNLKKLPLGLIQSLNSLITKVYQIQRLRQDQFLAFFHEDQQLKFKKTALIPLIDKVLKSLDYNKKNKNLSTKFNTNA